MKRWIFLLPWTLIAVTLGYGEPAVNSFGGVLFPAGKTTIELQDLSIVLEQQGERMRADGRYEFYNPEFERTLTVGFLTLPYIPADRQLDTLLSPNIEALAAEVNGEPVVLRVKQIEETEFQREIKEITELSYVCYASIRFRKGRNTVRLSYGFLPSKDSTGAGGQVYYHDPDPDVPNSAEILTGSEQALLRCVMDQEQAPDRRTRSLDLFLDKFRGAVLRHDWVEVFQYLDPDYLEDQVERRFGGNRHTFLSEIFGGVDHNSITALEYESYPEGLADDRVVASFDLEVSVPGSRKQLKYQIRRAGSSFRLVGPHDGVGNYQHGSFQVRGAQSILVKRRSVGDPYLRCYSTWIRDGSGAYINLDGGACDPDAWKSSHCSCPTVAGANESRYDLSRYTRTPYTGEVVVAVSSYVGYWQVEVEADAGSPSASPPARAGRPWSTPTDSTQAHAEVRDIRFRVADGILRGEATFLAWNRTGCPACIQQIVLISDHRTGGLYDAVCIDMGIPGLFPGKQRRLGFEISYREADTKIWAFPALQYTCEDAVSLARQNFLVYREKNLPIIGDPPVGSN